MLRPQACNIHVMWLLLCLWPVCGAPTQRYGQVLLQEEQEGVALVVANLC